MFHRHEANKPKDPSKKALKKVIFIFSKSPIPGLGRIGKRAWQDWHRTCVIASKIIAEDNGARIVLASDFSMPGRGHEIDCYKEAFSELGVAENRIEWMRRGMETLEQMQIAKELSAEHCCDADLVILCTLTHSPRVRYLRWKDGVRSSQITARLGLPMPREIFTDLFMALLLPLLDLFGLRKKFMDAVKRRRGGGKF